MNSIYIDTAILAVPNYAIDDVTGQEIINRLIHFSDLTSSDIPVNIIISENAENLLWEKNIGPDYEQIEQFLDIMGLKQIYSAHDLLQRYHLLFSKSIRACKINDIEAQTLSSFQSVPDLPNISPGLLMEETQRIFTTVAATQSHSQQIRVGSAFYSSSDTDYEVSVILEKAGGVLCPSLHILPRAISAKVTTLTHIRDLVSTLTADQLWISAQTAHDIHFSITLGALALQLQAGETINYTNLKPFAIGSEFIDSLIATDCWQDGRFSSAARDLCSQIVANKCNKNINPFSLKGQYIRDFDNAKAYRTHLTESGLALRLMHWEHAKGIEFSVIDAKSKERIEYGSTQPAACLDLREYFD